MTLGRRLALGLAAGALAALLLHPRSRPLVLTCFGQFGPSEAVATSTFLPENLDVLPVPKNEIEFSLWMQTGAERLLRFRDLKRTDLESLCVVADRAASMEPDNAYWPQMGAVFYNALGRRSLAVELWFHAANALRWDDYQSVRLERVAGQLAVGMGSTMSWQFARAYALRSIEPSRAIEQFGRSVLSQAGLDNPGGLRLRFATLKNGSLLRDGSRSVQSGDFGVNLVEYSCYPTSTLENPSPRKLWIARIAFRNSFRDAGMPWNAQTIDKAFLANDAWLALSGRERAPDDYHLFAIGSLATAVVPSALVGISMLGMLIIGLGAILHKNTRLHVLLRAPYAQAMGLLLALALYGLTKMPLVALTSVLCFGFLTFGPTHVRSKPPEYLGPFFRFTVFLLACVFMTTLMLFWAGLTTPAFELLPAMDAPPEFYGGQTLPLGLAGIAMALLLLVGPSWALVLRLPTPYVAVAAIREFGRMVFLTPLILAIISVPAALYADVYLGDALHKLLVNEPNYYLLQ